MAKTENPKETPSSEIDDLNDDQFQELLQPLEKHSDWDGRMMCHYNGSWRLIRCMKHILHMEKNFVSHDTDIILSTMPKSGTTWLKALTFSIVHRNSYSIDRHPLLTSNPHTLVPTIELQGYTNHHPNANARIFANHMHYDQLPNCIKESNSRVIFISRNPMDQFVSYYHFLLKLKADHIHVEEVNLSPVLSIDEAFELYCKGIYAFGPFGEHVLGYWNAYLKNPEKVLFLTYEDLKRDVVSNVKKIAEFIGFPFSPEEEKRGVIEQISELCSFDNLKNLEVNKGVNEYGVKFAHFFRKGETGDAANNLTNEMAERMEKLLEIKFRGSGLPFKCKELLV